MKKRGEKQEGGEGENEGEDEGEGEGGRELGGGEREMDEVMLHFSNYILDGSLGAETAGMPFTLTPPPSLLARPPPLPS